jgi:hypothetical protein
MVGEQSGRKTMASPPTCSPPRRERERERESTLGGFKTMLHNEIVYVYSEAMQDAGYKVVELEPHLEPLSGNESFKYKSTNRQDEARSDISVEGFWSRQRRAFFDVTAFSPLAQSNKDKSLRTLYRDAEGRKKREYFERIQKVDRGDFNPLVFSLTGGMGPQARTVTQRIAQRLAERQGLPYSVVIGWLKVRISFALNRSVLVCLRGTRSQKASKAEVSIDLAVSEAKIDY